MFEVSRISPELMATSQTLKIELSQMPGVKHRVVIPAGYNFDGTSIPWWAWWVIGTPYDPPFLMAACVHDWYVEHARECGDYQQRVIGDAVFFKLLRDAGVKKWKRTIMYVAVRSYAWFAIGRKSPVLS